MTSWLHTCIRDSLKTKLNTRRQWRFGEIFGAESPRLDNAFAVGDRHGFSPVPMKIPFSTAIPIFSAYSPTRRCGIRVIQYPPTSKRLELDYWLDTFGGELGEPETIRELVIACSLSDEAATRASELMEMWCMQEEIVESQAYVRVFDYGPTEIPIALAASC